MSKKYENVCTILNYIEHFYIFAFIITGCILLLPLWLVFL